MFLIRTAFWLSVVILLLPAEEAPGNLRTDASNRQELDTASVITAARNTVSDISGICERSPDVCEVGSAALDVFLRKARYGAGLVLGMISEPGDGTQLIGPTEHRTVRHDEEPQAAPVSRNTLKPEDLEPAWREPGSDRKA